MVFLSAFPLSFSIIWRYALVLPLLILALFLFSIIAAIPMAVLGLVSPLIGLVIAIAFSFASSVVPIMVGSRVGLQSYDVKSRNSYLGLILPAMAYGLFEGLCLIVLLALFLGAFVAISGINASEFLTAQSTEAALIAQNMVDQSTGAGVAIILVFSLVVVALRSALLVPLTGASIGADPDGRKHTPFYGFGDGFGSLFALVCVSYIGTALAVPLGFLVAVPFGIVSDFGAMSAELTQMTELAAIAAAEGTEDTTSWFDLSVAGPSGIVFVVASVVFFLYAFSLQCAGAVLVFLKHKGVVAINQRSVDAELARMQDKPMAKTDMMELMRSRMPTRRED